MSTETCGAARARSKHLRRMLLGACVCLIIYGTLYPFTGWRTPGNFHRLFSAAALDHVSAADVLANVFLYMPLGFLSALGRRLRTIPVILLAALLLSLGVEILQAFLPERVASWLDVATNVFGAGAGAVLATAAAMTHWPDGGWGRNPALRLPGDRVAWLGMAALAAWGCAQLIPFVPSLDVSALKAGLQPLWHTLQGARPVDLWCAAVYAAATAVLTITGGSVLRLRNRSGAAAVCLLAVLPLKVLVTGRQLSPEALAGTCVGVALGVVLWASGRRRALVGGALLIPVYIVAEGLHPGAPNIVLHAFNWIPLHAQLAEPINGLANLADAVWPPLALACLCLRLEMRSLWYLLPAVVLLLFAVEWTQLWIPGRYPDITAVLTGTAAWAAAAAYAGKPPRREQA
ncbi:VanZ family protein [Rhodanobacter sp. KK11]|jgi:VanZ family protein|uniref:VanZ family protein n=1 Tax=Rhodanobacter sp. KK11 TaxID=3083255 RepID=UPI00296726C4|nr:VanZ family protein [Rhodanobacter sp. KK11]MDW2983314.1 VanZ family protein [Rhodanobacter sp. KK11]